MNRLIELINKSETENSVLEFRNQWNYHPWYSRYLALLFPISAACVEIKFPSPHMLKYHHALTMLCAKVDGEIAASLLERYIQYLGNKTRLHAVPKSPQVETNHKHTDYDKDLERSMSERSFHNSLYYALRLRDKIGFLETSKRLLSYCISEIDLLGHNFTCPFGMIEAGIVSDRQNENTALASLVEFTLRMFKSTAERLKKPNNDHNTLRLKASERPGFLGHNVIFADRIERAFELTVIDDKQKQHLLYFLEDNIREAPFEITIDSLYSPIKIRNGLRESLNKIQESIISFNQEKLFGCIIDFLRIYDDMEALSNHLTALLVSIDELQPHFYTYASAVYDFAERHPELREVLYCGLAQFIMEYGNKCGWIDRNTGNNPDCRI